MPCSQPSESHLFTNGQSQAEARCTAPSTSSETAQPLVIIAALLLLQRSGVQMAPACGRVLLPALLSSILASRRNAFFFARPATLSR